MDILSLFACFEPLVSPTTERHFSKIVQAVLTMSGKVTMLGISRWTEKGGSYRTLQRFFATALPWTELFVKFFESHLFKSEREYILAGDETVVTKAGSQTFGIDRLFSGLSGKTVKGLGFFVLSVVAVGERKAYPLAVKQVVRSEAEKTQARNRQKKRLKKSKQAKRSAKGRKPGSRNRDKNQLKFSAELMRINEMLKVLMKLIGRFIKVRYLAMDGHFGHHQAVLMARECELHLISKMRPRCRIV